MPSDQKLYLEAFSVCRKQLQTCLDKLGERSHAWLKAEPRHPSFADLIFRVGNRIYAVLIVRVEHAHGHRNKLTNLQISVITSERDLFLNECKRFNMQPLFFPMWMGSMTPFSMDWNLLIPESGRLSDPSAEEDSPQPVPMSEWELCNIRVSTVLEHLRKQHLQIISWQDIPDIRPNILFRAADGAVCWVIVTSAESSEILPSSAEINKQLPDSPDEVRGYSARVGLRSTKDLSSPPPRGDSFFINFTGLDPL